MKARASVNIIIFVVFVVSLIAAFYGREIKYFISFSQETTGAIQKLTPNAQFEEKWIGANDRHFSGIFGVITRHKPEMRMPLGISSTKGQVFFKLEKDGAEYYSFVAPMNELEEWVRYDQIRILFPWLKKLSL